MSANTSSLEDRGIERAKIRVDLFKWIVGGLVAIIGFVLIRPREQERLDAALQLETHKAYLAATDTPDPDLWLRKLNLLLALVSETDKKLRDYLEAEKRRIDSVKSTIEEAEVASEKIARLDGQLRQLEESGGSQAERGELQAQLDAQTTRFGEFSKQLRAQGLRFESLQEPGVRE